MSDISFNNTAIAFAHKSKRDLSKARLLFKSFRYSGLLKHGPLLAKIVIALGLKSLIKQTIFKQFCGGETIEECNATIHFLAQSRLGTILDYSVEGEEDETNFIATAEEIIRTIDLASGNSNIPFCVFKLTGIMPFETLVFMSRVIVGGSITNIDLLQKSILHLETNDDCDPQVLDTHRENWALGSARFNLICSMAHSKDVRLFVDAEESYIQTAIDLLAENAMAQYNQSKAIVYNTVQLYRHDRLEYLRQQILSTQHFLGVKLVRGAYMEKERERSISMAYESPIHKNKEATDRDYNAAVSLCMEHLNRVSICIGTHNDESNLLGVRLMEKKNILAGDERVYFSQLLGMSDHISFNLSNIGYRVGKYVPYGPVSGVIPYLTRRARENSGMSGQMGRELQLIEQELTRRKG